jgi:transposase-like protein
MDERHLEEWGEVLAAEVGDHVGSRRSKKWRCPLELRSRIVEYARSCREQGWTVGDIAAGLGLVESTLARWLRRGAAELQPGFRPVAIVASDDRASSPAAALRLVTPHGYRVEGLDADTLAYLLQVLR